MNQTRTKEFKGFQRVSFFSRTVQRLSIYLYIEYIELCFVVYKNFWQSAQWIPRA